MRRRDLLRTAAAAGVAGLAGCSYRPGSGDPRWLHRLTGGPRAVLTPPDGGGPVLIVPGGPQIVLLDAATGTTRLTHRFETTVERVGRTFPTAGRPLPVVLAEGEVHLLYRRDGDTATPDDTSGDGDDGDSGSSNGASGGDGETDVGTGSFRGQRLATVERPVEAVAHDGRLTYVVSDGAVVALGPEGAERWRRADVTDDIEQDRLVPDRRGVLVASALSRIESRVVALDRRGRVRWELADGAVGEPAAVPVPFDDGVCVSCREGFVSLDREGNYRWVHELRYSRHRPTIAGDTVYVSGGQLLDAIGLENGVRHWQYRLDRGRFTGPPAATPERAFVPEDGQVLAVEDGDIVWSATHGRAYVPVGRRPLRVAGGSLVVVAAGGVAAYWRQRDDHGPFPFT